MSKNIENEKKNALNDMKGHTITTLSLKGEYKEFLVSPKKRCDFRG
jgi:uncharacterized membrane-anchored protein YitT (DUF2179 family)